MAQPLTPDQLQAWHKLLEAAGIAHTAGPVYATIGDATVVVENGAVSAATQAS
jgi:hypothetical protein